MKNQIAKTCDVRDDRLLPACLGVALHRRALFGGDAGNAQGYASAVQHGVRHIHDYQLPGDY